MTKDHFALDVLPPVRHTPPPGGGCQRKTGKEGGRRTMGNGRGWGWLLLGLGLAAGCNQRDKECLARVGRKLVGKAETAASGNVPGQLGNGLQTVRASASAEHGLDARVACRIRWDRSLADTPIEVLTRGRVIELKGTVHDLAARRRAVDLAATTAGVERVIDLLDIPKDRRDLGP
jgi:hypothetical protein